MFNFLPEDERMWGLITVFAVILFSVLICSAGVLDFQANLIESGLSLSEFLGF